MLSETNKCEGENNKIPRIRKEEEAKNAIVTDGFCVLPSLDVHQWREKYGREKPFLLRQEGSILEAQIIRSPLFPIIRSPLFPSGIIYDLLEPTHHSFSATCLLL